MNTTPPEDPELAQLIERHLDGDPAATATLDARLANDPAAALAFASANRMEVLLATHHQRARAESRLTRFIRPLSWLAAAASLGFLAWVAFRPIANEDTTGETPVTTPPVRKVLSPLRMERPPSVSSGIPELAAADIEAKASRFYLPEINVNTLSVADAMEQVQREFRRIAVRQGDENAPGIRFTAKGFEAPIGTDTPPTVRLTAGGNLKTVLAKVALQAGGVLTYGNGSVTIERAPSVASAAATVMKAFPFKDESFLHFLTGEVPPVKVSEPGDHPFGVGALTRIIPELGIENATLEEAIAFVTEKSRELDPSGAGSNVVLKRRPGDESDRGRSRITLNLRNVSIRNALEKIAQSAGLIAVEQEHATVIASEHDPLFAVRPIEFSLPGLKASFNSREGILALEGEEHLVDAAGTNLASMASTTMQVLIVSRFLCLDPSDVAGTAEGLDLTKGDQIATSARFRDFEDAISRSEHSTWVSSPSIVTRESQRAKLEIIKEIIFRVPQEDGSIAFEMAPAGWTMDLNPTFIGDAVHLMGVLRFSSLRKSPGPGDLQIGGTRHPQGDPPTQSAPDPESLPIGNPLHSWELEFEAELLSSQKALLHFMDLADGSKVYAIVSAERIDSSGQRIYPASEE